MAATFIGMSTVGKKKPPFTLTDQDLIKQDLLNHFSVRRGDIVGNTSFGTIIHDVVMDQLDSYSRAIIVEDVQRIISEDPRVKLSSPLNIVEYDNGIRIEVDLYYVPFDSSELLYLDFKKQIMNKE
jgi:hypothetical protein